MMECYCCEEPISRTALILLCPVCFRGTVLYPNPSYLRCSVHGNVKWKPAWIQAHRPRVVVGVR